jgi:hypothetical protein
MQVSKAALGAEQAGSAFLVWLHRLGAATKEPLPPKGKKRLSLAENLWFCT